MLDTPAKSSAPTGKGGNGIVMSMRRPHRHEHGTGATGADLNLSHRVDSSLRDSARCRAASRQAIALYSGDWKQTIHKTLSTQFAKKIHRIQQHIKQQACHTQTNRSICQQSCIRAHIKEGNPGRLLQYCHFIPANIAKVLLTGPCDHTDEYGRNDGREFGGL